MTDPIDQCANRITCPHCGGDLKYVKDSRPRDFHGIRTVARKRDCDNCGQRSTTIEIPEVKFTAIKKEIARRLVLKLLETEV